MMKFLYPFAFTFILSGAIKGQTTITIAAGKDNTIYSENNAQSNGQSQFLYAGRTGVNAGSVTRRALVYFNIDAIPPGATITSVSVSLYCNNLSSAGVSAGINLHRVLNDWGEGASGAANSGGLGSPAATNDATWANRFYNTSLWTTAGGDFSATVSGTAVVNQAGAVLISSNTLVSDVQGWLANTANNFGWEIIGSSEVTSNTARRFGSRENATTSERPQLTVTYTGGLPVTLKSFTAAIQQQNALLEWKTSTEINNNYFNVEHSTDGRNYSVAGKVKGAGNSFVENNYSFVHRDVPQGKNYYRLAQYDLNGEVKYSPVVVAKKTSSLLIKAGPNPVSTLLYITSNEPVKGKSFLILSATGQLVQKGVLGNLPVNVSGLSKGVYFISVRAANKSVETRMFVKN